MCISTSTDPSPGSIIMKMDIGVVGEQGHGHRGVGEVLSDHQAVRRMPKGLSWLPACQMETRSAFQVSTGPTEGACVGTREMLPPPEVRAFWMIVIGCRSTTRVRSRRYSSGVGGASSSRLRAVTGH